MCMRDIRGQLCILLESKLTPLDINLIQKDFSPFGYCTNVNSDDLILCKHLNQ